jgi:hypothetical protein
MGRTCVSTVLSTAALAELFEFVTLSSRGFAIILLRSCVSPIWYYTAHIHAILGLLFFRALLPSMSYGKSQVYPSLPAARTRSPDRSTDALPGVALVDAAGRRRRSRQPRLQRLRLGGLRERRRLGPPATAQTRHVLGLERRRRPQRQGAATAVRLRDPKIPLQVRSALLLHLYIWNTEFFPQSCLSSIELFCAV